MAGPPLRRALATLAVAGLVAAGCVTAGTWQWHRHQARSAEVAAVLAHERDEPVPLATVVHDAPLAADQRWRQVSVSGRYVGDQVLLRNRPVGGIAGFHVLAGLAVVDGPLAGRVLVVDRGFVPLGADAATSGELPGVPTGTVDVVVRLRPDELASDRPAPAGQVHAINAEQVRVAAGQPWSAATTLPATGAAVAEQGEPPAGLGTLPAPSTDLGPHLSYAFQWWVFAAGAIGGAIVLLRRDAETPARAPRRRTAEQEEDAWVDADPG